MTANAEELNSSALSIINSGTNDRDELNKAVELLGQALKIQFILFSFFVSI